jgi:hypothetical protein
MSGSIGTIMNPGMVAPPDIIGNQGRLADIAKTQAGIGLIGAQTQQTQAQAGLIGAQTATEGQKPALIGAQTGLTQAQAELAAAQTGAVPSEIALRGAQSQGALAGATSALATAGETGQDAYAKRLQNLLTANGINKSGTIGQVPPAPPVSGGQLPIGPEVAPDAKPFIPPAGQGLLRALSPSEASAPNVRYVPPGSGRSPTFDPSQGHPGIGAAGLYQFEPATWQEAAKGAGVDPKDMSQGNQDRAAWWLAQRTYKQNTGGDLDADLTQGGHEAEITASLASQWPSLASGDQHNKTGASFLQRLRLTVQHEVAAAGKAPPGGVPGPDSRSGVAPDAQVAGPGAPSGGTAPAVQTGPVMVRGRASPGLEAIRPGGLMGTPEQAIKFDENRANNMAALFSSAPDEPSGIAALADNQYITPKEQQTLLANPGTARSFIAHQLPISQQPTPGEKVQIERDTPFINEDAKVNQENVDAGLRAGQDQYNLRNIKTLVAGTPDGALGAAAQSRTALQAYATQFGGQWGQALVGKLTGVDSADLPVLQELGKSFLSNVLSNERTQGVARIGAMSTQYFAKASPSTELTKPATQQIANTSLVSQQMTRDFADASNTTFATNRKTTNDSLVNGPYQQYQPLANTLQKEWLAPDSIHNPSVYAAAANLMNGMAPSKAFSQLKPEQQQEALHIIDRTDPSEKAAILARRGQ